MTYNQMYPLSISVDHEISVEFSDIYILNVNFKPLYPVFFQVSNRSHVPVPICIGFDVCISRPVILTFCLRVVASGGCRLPVVASLRISPDVGQSDPPGRGSREAPRA